MTSKGDQQFIQVEVVLAMPTRQKIISLELAADSTVADAISKSGLPGSFEDFDLNPETVGIFGRKVSPEQVLRDGDRVELYRPLIADPKEVRRQRALKQAKT